MPSENPASFMLEEFALSPFPPQTALPGRPDGFIYVLCWVKDGREIPFYVGQTTRLSERIGDYVAAQFSAATDFRVGTRAKYLREKHTLEIVVRYRASTAPPSDEYLLIRQLQLSGVRLLNELQGYDWATADKAQEAAMIDGFCDVLLRQAQLPRATAVRS